METSEITATLQDGFPNLKFWRNKDPNHIYQVSFNYIFEINSDDMIFAGLFDWTGAKIYNLQADWIPWEYSVHEYGERTTVTISSEHFSEIGKIEFQFHIFYNDQINYHDPTYYYSNVTYNIKGLTEIKVDININGWNYEDFAEDTTGLALHVKVKEISNNYKIKLGKNINIPEEFFTVEDISPLEITNRTSEPDKHGIIFTGRRDIPTAFFSWMPEIDLYSKENAQSLYKHNNTFRCTATAASFGLDLSFGENLEFGKDYANLYLVYPIYGEINNPLYSHDPIIGIWTDAPSLSSFSCLGLISLPIIAIFIMRIRERSEKTRRKRV